MTVQAERHRDTLRLPLIGCGIVLCLSFAAVTFARVTRMETVHVPIKPAVASVELFFADVDDGSIRITDARDGRLVSTLAPGTNGFIRTVMRGMVRVRQRAGIGADTPFRLERAPDSHLSLLDPATGRRIELIGFGDLNAAAFARLMPADAGGRS